MCTELALADHIAAPRFWSRSRKMLYGCVFGGLAALGLHSALADWRDHHAFLVNVSPSLPNWAFVIQTGSTAKRGDYVFFDPPKTPLVVAHFGVKPSMFGKMVYGVGGDIVTRVGRTFYVSGRPVAVAKPYSRQGEPLALGPTGTIPAGCYFVGSPHKDGFDSRYAAIGWICQSRIVGTGTPVL